MKKSVSWVLVCICVLMLVACNNNSTDNPIAENEYVFHARVLEISDHTLLVEPTGDCNEANCSDKIRISLEPGICPENLEVGDSVMITYDGVIQELYPAIIPNVHSIQKDQP